MPRDMPMLRNSPATTREREAHHGSAAAASRNVEGDGEDTTDILEWYRRDDSRRVKAILVRGGLLTLAGALLVSHGVGPASQGELGLLWVGALGLLLTGLGPLATIVGLCRALDDDQYIALRRDGLCIHTPEHAGLVAWDDLESVCADAQGSSLRVTRRDGGELWLRAGFAGVDAQQLAERIGNVHRKAIWNLLHTLG